MNAKYFDKAFTNSGYSFLVYLQLRSQKTITCFKGTGISTRAPSQKLYGAINQKLMMVNNTV